VLGGIGNLRGAMLGGVLLGLIESLARAISARSPAAFSGSHYQDALAFVC